MQINKKILLFLILSTLIYLLAGCAVLEEPIEIILRPLSSKPSPPPVATAKRFQESVPKGPTAVESVIDISERYVKLSEQMAELQQQNQNLTTENSQLKDRLATVEPQLEQTEKNLADAEKFLVEMRIELNNWKTDILGYRNEIRQATKAELEALYKILVILGGEVNTASSQDQGLAAVLPSRTLQQTQTSGEPNE